MRTLLLGLALGALAGCDGLPGLGSPTDTPPVRAMFISGGDVVISAPDGYCIDGRASRARAGFAVMAGCALVSNDAVMPFTDGLITVQVSDPGTATVAGAESDLSELLSSAAGVSLLSPSGDPSSISVDALQSRPNMVSVHFTDSTPPPFDGLEQTEWRAFFDLGDRLATVTVRGFARSPLSENAGLALLDQTVRALVNANQPGAAAPATPAG